MRGAKKWIGIMQRINPKPRLTRSSMTRETELGVLSQDFTSSTSLFLGVRLLESVVDSNWNIKEKHKNLALGYQKYICSRWKIIKPVTSFSLWLTGRHIKKHCKSGNKYMQLKHTAVPKLRVALGISSY